jgi:hypothetical protein
MVIDQQLKSGGVAGRQLVPVPVFCPPHGAFAPEPVVHAVADSQDAERFGVIAFRCHTAKCATVLGSVLPHTVIRDCKRASRTVLS